ncbi:MAG: hypothetical protein QOH59_1649 [Gemmatimonadales bacterium]|jgi:hypothetical protein|nr:hypothetical protein [Gemmatimonadales bacterium]
MAQLNSSRVIVGGLAAGLVMNVIDATTNGFLLGNRWMVETEALNPGLLAKAESGTMGWVLVDFILGILTVWVYAAIRPRLGPGPRTAFTAAFVIWLAAHAAYASYAFMGYYSWSLVGASSMGGLVASLAGGYLGARLYREAA